MEITDIAKQAIIAFESDKANSFETFEENAKLLYNSFAVYPSRLSQVENPYLIGMVYSYLEGGLREYSDIAQVCFNNACYCFSKVIITSKSTSERQCAAIRLFLLTNEVGTSAFNLCLKVVEQNCKRLKGMDYNTYRMIMRGGDFMSDIRFKVRDIGHFCYSIFTQGSYTSLISVYEMRRVQEYIGFYNEPLSTLPGNEFYLKELFFEMFCNYLATEVESYSISRITKI